MRHQQSGSVRGMSDVVIDEREGIDALDQMWGEPEPELHRSAASQIMTFVSLIVASGAFIGVVLSGIAFGVRTILSS